jgi:dTDP-4-amino-4,6-dideoxygalactose transaminase
VLAEIDETMTLDLDDVEQKLTPNVKAVIPVDMVGFPCDMKRLCQMRDKYGFKIVEDACQADGGSFNQTRLGLWGDVGALSFNDFKIMTAGEGGALLTNDRKVFERALIYHDGGAAFRPNAKSLREPIFMGTQYRVSEITGAILRVQLRRLDGMLDDLRRIKKTIIDSLAGLPGIRFAPSHDSAGDCATTVAFTFTSEAKARQFATSEGVGAWLPIDSGKHVYSNWDPLLALRGSHCAALNPFKMKQNKGLRTSYSPDMCPKTLDILARTAYISLHPDWTDEKVTQVIDSCRKAADLIK